MTTTTEPTTTQVADVLDKAADIVDKNGLHKGYLYDEKQAKTGINLAVLPVDAVGAVNGAVFDVPSWPAEEHEGSPLAQAAVLALEETVGAPVPGWNDERSRQKRQVVKALRDTAARLREAK